MAKSSAELSAGIVVDLTEETLIRVLHVDDEAGFLKAAKQILEMQGSFQVDTASSVEEAMKKMKRRSYDVIVSDYLMPGKNGLAFLKELRESGNNIPFIIFTGKGREIVAIKALNLGADLYVNKIGNPETVYAELAHSIRQALKRKRAEKALRESEEKFRLAFEDARDGIFWADPGTGLIINCNRAAETLLEKKRGEIVGHSQTMLHPPDKAEYYTEMFKRHIEQKGAVDEEADVITKSGKIKPVHITASVTVVGGKPLIQGIFRDITERKKAEQAIRESQQMFEELFRDNPEAAVYVDPKFRISDVNPRFEHMFGYSLDEIKGKRLLEVIVPEDSLEDAKMLDEKAKKGHVYYDAVRKRKDGSLVPVSISAAPITIEDKLIGYVGLYKDISELKKAQQQLGESQRHFQTLFNLMVDPVAIVDRKGKILAVTDKVEEITGFGKEELVGRNFLRTKVASAKTKAILMKNLAKRMMGMHLTPYEIEILTKDGRKVSFELNAEKIDYKGKPADMVVFRDITERKKMEDKLLVVGELSRHDARNKLSAVIMNIFLAKKKLAGDHEALQYLNEIELAVGEMERIFDFARAYEKLGMEKLVYMDVEKTLEETVHLFSDLQNVKVVNDCRGLTVLADSLLRQLFYNLIHNSLRHGEKVSQIRLYYKTDRDQLKLVYEDDGVGIPKAEKDKIFVEGYGRGTGYGLYLIRKMCEVYGWAIRETGKHGKGAQFNMSIPKMDKTGKTRYQLSRNK